MQGRNNGGRLLNKAWMGVCEKNSVARGQRRIGLCKKKLFAHNLIRSEIWFEYLDVVCHCVSLIPGW